MSRRPLWLDAPSQPPGIDWSSPITHRLERAWTARFAGYEAVSGKAVAPNGVSITQGEAAHFATATGPIDLGPVGAVSRPITIRVRWLAHTANMATHMLANMPAASGNGFRIEAYTTFGGIYIVPTYNGVANLPAPVHIFSAFGQRALMDYVAVMSATELSHYLNGALLGTSAAASFASAPAGSTLKIGAAGGIGQVIAVEYWGRLLAADEIRLLSLERPWSVYRSPVRRRKLLLVGGGATLAIADTSHAHAADALTLTQVHALDVAEALHGHSAEALTLAVGAVLTAADATHSHLVDSPALTQAHAIAIAEALHAHTAEAVVLTQAHLLAIADAAHVHQAEAVTLGATGMLAIADALHPHLADALVLGQAHILAISDAAHAHLVDVLSLALPGAVWVGDRVLYIQAERRVLAIVAESRWLAIAAERRLLTIH